MQAHPEYAMCFHNTISIAENDTTQQVFSGLTEARDYTLADLFEKNITNTSAVVYRNIPIEIPSMLSTLSVGDWALHILHAAHGKIRYLPDMMSAYRVHQAGVWSQRSLVARIEKSIEMLEKIDEFFDFTFHQPISSTIGKFSQLLTWDLLEINEYKKSRHYFRKAVENGAFNTVDKVKYYVKCNFPGLYTMMKKIKRT